MKKFKKIGLIGRSRSEQSTESIKIVAAYLKKHHYEIVIEQTTAASVIDNTLPVISQEKFGQNSDLVIVVGGDGSLLNAAHLIVDYGIPVIGINRGRLGFLTDIHPNEIEKYLDEVLSGQYIEEKRFLLQAQIRHDGKILHQEKALNDVVLLPGEYVRMIEFEIYINKQLVCSQRADGQIIATPTGSTAYALSGGGPILHPSLDAVVLVPMFPHTLSARPIVVAGNSEIDLVIAPTNETSPCISCDGFARKSIAPGDSLHITKHDKLVTILHPKDYLYYKTLRDKLHWQKSFT